MDMLPDLEVVTYVNTTVLFIATSTTRLLFESVINVWPLGRRLANAAPFKMLVLAGSPYCHTIWWLRLTSITRLLFSSAIRTLPFASNVEARKERGLHRGVELIGSRSCHSSLTVLPDDPSVGRDEEDPIVKASVGVGARRVGTGWGTSARDQSERPYSFGVVGTHHRMRACHRRSVAELPHDLVIPVDLNDPVVELVGDQDVATGIEPAAAVAFLCSGRQRPDHNNQGASCGQGGDETQHSLNGRSA
jgi:hypothetical protein